MLPAHRLPVALLVSLFMTSCLAWAAAPPRTTQPPYASAKPLSEPTVFADGVISTGDYESHPEFTPDGKTLYFLKNTPTFSFWTIVVSRYAGGKWSAPEVAPFSGQYADADPFITPDGSKFYFISNRPVEGKEKQDLDIWMMERNGDAWSAPKNLGAPINSPGNEWFPTLAKDGTLYFGSDREGGKGRTDLYRSRLVNGRYAAAENLGDEINTPFNEFEPYISLDESFLIFMAGGRSDGRGGTDLYVSYNRAGKWTKPLNLGDQINSSGTELSPKVSPDGKYFFWTSTRGFADKPLAKPMTYQEYAKKLHNAGNGLGDIYQIDLSALKLER